MLFSKKDAQSALENGYEEAEELLEDVDKLEAFLQKLEQKLKKMPIGGKELSYVPAMISLVRSYIKKEYTNIPYKSIVIIVSALAYFLSPVDFIPDFIPVIGYADDLAVIGFCLHLTGSDIEAYNAWRVETGRLVENHAYDDEI